jgi:hypothetical protein
MILLIGRDPAGRKINHKALMWKLHRWANDLVEGSLVGQDFIPFEHRKKRRVKWLDQAD